MKWAAIDHYGGSVVQHVGAIRASAIGRESVLGSLVSATAGSGAEAPGPSPFKLFIATCLINGIWVGCSAFPAVCRSHGDCLVLRPILCQPIVKSPAGQVTCPLWAILPTTRLQKKVPKVPRNRPKPQTATQTWQAVFTESALLSVPTPA